MQYPTPRLACATLALVLASAQAVPGQSELHTWYGDGLFDAFGYTADWAGDVDGDGHDDVIAGAPYGNGKFGMARVFSGRDGSILHSMSGSSFLSYFGESVAGGGDVNGDGIDDMVVASRSDDTFGPNFGSVTAFSGADGSVLHLIGGTANSTWFGWAVDICGDVDGDGHADIVVGAHRDGTASPYAGRAFVFSGKDGAVIHVLDGGPSISGSAFGFSVSRAGDMDMDGLADFAVGARFADAPSGTTAGRVFVYSGASASVLHDWWGDHPQDYLGISVDLAGDVDRDGVPDLIAGASGSNTHSDWTGWARVYSGADGSVLWTMQGDTKYGMYAESVAGAGDVNGDGHADLLVGASTEDWDAWGYAPYARLYSGVDGSLMRQFDGAYESSLGRAVAGGGDANADGIADMLLGAPWADAPAGIISGSVAAIAGGPVWPFGWSCGGAQAGWQGDPQIGSSGFVATASGVPALSPLALVIGASRTSWFGLPLPLDLGSVGAPGCALLVALDATANTTGMAGGTAQIPLSIPDDMSLGGVTLHLQWVVVDPPANPLGMTVSDALAVTVQP